MFTFIESHMFERRLPVYLDDGEYSELQTYLIGNPTAGVVIPGSGGIRKLRWKREGMGKRGGLRIIYYFQHDSYKLWMLAIYAKAALDDIPKQILDELRKEFTDE
jgi:hypothetical protein